MFRSLNVINNNNTIKILPDGGAASLMEHTPVDGHAALSLFALVDRFAIGNK